MLPHDDPELALARALLDDGRRDREVLRERWQQPRWRDDVLRIATALERDPALISVVEAAIANHLAASDQRSAVSDQPEEALLQLQRQPLKAES
jgi:hypothetical protein